MICIVEYTMLGIRPHCFLTSSVAFLYSIELLYEPMPYWRTYNKLSEEDNILETLTTYVDYLIEYQIRTDYSNTIITFNVDVPFEVGLKIEFGWIKQIIDIYR